MVEVLVVVMMGVIVVVVFVVAEVLGPSGSVRGFLRKIVPVYHLLHPHTE